MINSQANIKMHCLPFHAVWHWGRNNPKIDPGTKQPHSRERPRKRIPQRIRAVFHSNFYFIPTTMWNVLELFRTHQSSGMVLRPLWLCITVALVNAPYCEFRQIFILSFFLIMKTGALILLSHAACTSLSTQQGHIQDGIKAKYLLFFVAAPSLI